jgi:predicted dehydrogenase
LSVGWAILGTGGFPDEKVAPALNMVDGGELISVMSRYATRAAKFGPSMAHRLVTTP